MPVVSQQQNKAMHAAAEGHSTLGIPKSVGQDFVNASHGTSVKALPKFKHHANAAHKAFAAGDHSQAMHHAGHMLRMAKSAASGGLSGVTTSAATAPSVQGDEPQDADMPAPSAPTTGGLGNFLNRPGPAAPKAPAPPSKPSFAAKVRSRFAQFSK